jgi:hypothetical protein
VVGVGFREIFGEQNGLIPPKVASDRVGDVKLL